MSSLSPAKYSASALLALAIVIVLSACSDSKPKPPDDGDEPGAQKAAASCEQWSACVRLNGEALLLDLAVSADDVAALSAMCPEQRDQESAALSRLDSYCR